MDLGLNAFELHLTPLISQLFTMAKDTLESFRKVQGQGAPSGMALSFVYHNFDHFFCLSNSARAAANLAEVHS